MSFSNTPIKEMKGTKYGNMIHPWLFQKEDLIRDTPSRRDGMSYEEELAKLQQGGLLIFDIVMQLSSGKGEHGLNGVAATLFNRFFKVHSLKTCDFRDVAAACVFLAGKNEDQPRKLKYVVNQLWQCKFPKNKTFPTEQHFVDQCEVVTFLEEVILKTIAFDLNIDLPHQFVLKLMSFVEKGRSKYKEMVKAAYYLVSDVLLITDWTVRYSCSAIATACVKIAAVFQNIELDQIIPLDAADTWYRLQDDTTTLAQIDEMTKEFLEIYSQNPHLHHIGILKKINCQGIVKIIARSPPEHVSSSSSSSSCPPPPPSQPKKIDMDAYKGRSKTTTSEATGSMRQSFMPDVKDQRVVERGLAEKKREMEMLERQRQMRVEQQKQSFEEQQRMAPKRPHGPDEVNVTKKTRMDYHMNFVAASSSSSFSSNNYSNPHQNQRPLQRPPIVKTEMSAYAISVSQMSTTITPSPSQEPPSAYQQMCMDWESKRRPAPVDTSRMAPSSTQQISPPDDASPPLSYLPLPPPPRPPPMLPRAVHTGHDELEEGELV